MSDPYNYDDDSSSGDEDYDERDWTKDANGFHARELWAPHARTKWRFALPYFTRVSQRCAFSDKDRDDTHAVRIGRDVHDWWTDVHLEKSGLDPPKGTPLAQRTARYQHVDEALRIMGVMARADYKGWLGHFIRDANYLVPKFMKLRFSEQLPRTFAFVIAPHLAPVFYHWEMLRYALSPEQDSDTYTRDVARVVKTADTVIRKKNAPVNWREKLLDPISIKLVVAPVATSADNQIKILQGVTKTVMQLQMIEAAWRNASAGSTTRAPPVFHLECLDLDLRTFHVHANVLRVLRKLLETGAKLRLGWGLFLSTALGHRALPNGKAVQIDSLVVPGAFMNEVGMVSLLSAVTTTTALKRLRIETSARTRNDAATQSPTWKWLAYALLSGASRNAIDTLDLHRFQMTIQSLNVAKEVARAKDPLATLWKSTTGTTTKTDPLITSEPRALVEIASNAPIAGRGFSRVVPVVESTFTYTATVVRDDPSESTVDVLIPGFGFCQVARAHTSPADVPMETPPWSTHPLDTLVVGNKLTGIATHAFVTPLLQLIGPKLTALALESNDIDATNVRDAARLCPKLQSLRLRGVTLRSMDVITRLYDQPTFHVSSLELRDVKLLPIASFEAFLKRLAEYRTTTDRLVNTLRRLRVGEGWSETHRASTDELFEELLSGNRMLSHFYLVGRPQNLNVGWDIEDYNFGGESVPNCPLPLPTRVGLLSVLRQSPAGEKLSPELVKHILDFGATTWRRVAFRVDGGVVPFGIK